MQENYTTPGLQNPTLMKREYRIWALLKNRCKNKKSLDYKNYGERGISFPKKWEKFSGFWEDMSPNYSENLTIDRINNNLSYSKKNCRWSTKSEQARNRRSNVYLVCQKEKKLITEWAKSNLYSLSLETIQSRKKRGWNDSKILLTPINIKYKNKRKKLC